MDIVFEALVDLFLEGTFELTKNKKVSKWIRYPLMVIISLIFGRIFLNTTGKIKTVPICVANVATDAPNAPRCGIKSAFIMIFRSAAKK